MNTLLWVLLIGFGLWWMFRVVSGKRGSGNRRMGGGGCGGGHSHHSSHSEHGTTHSHSGTQQISEMVTDPVCRMAIDKDKTAYTLDYGGKTFHFCSTKCYESFKADPEAYLLKRYSVC